MKLFFEDNFLVVKTLVSVLILIFTCLSCKSDEPEPNEKVIPEPDEKVIEAVLDLFPAQKIGLFEATVGFRIEAKGNEIFDHGVVWGVTSSPNTNGVNKISRGTCAGSCPAEVMIDKLQSGKTYYYRAYIISKSGITYSNERAFTTIEALYNQDANFPGGGRMLGVAFSIGGKGYIGLGKGEGNAFLKDFWEYNPETKSWTKKADFPGGIRIGSVGFAINGKGYVGTGLNGNYEGTSDFWEYDPINDSWVRKADYIGGSIEYATGIAIGEKGYVGIGTRRSTGVLVKEFYEFSPATNAWTKLPDFPGIAVNNCFSFVLNGKGYVGIGQTNSGAITKQFWEFNPALNTWIQKKDYAGNARYYSTGFALNGKGYSCSGRNGGSEVLEYNPDSNEWKPMTDFTGRAREGHSIFVIGDQAFIGLGSTGFDYLSDMWRFKLVQ